jgi:hypothetical protein
LGDEHTITHVDRGRVRGWETSTQSPSLPFLIVPKRVIHVQEFLDSPLRSGTTTSKRSNGTPTLAWEERRSSTRAKAIAVCIQDDQSACVRACVHVHVHVPLASANECGVESVPAFPRACVCVCDDAPVWSCCASQDACRCYPHGHDAVLLSGSLAVGSSLRCHSARSCCAQAFTHARQNSHTTPRRLNVAVRSTRLILASPSKPSRQTVCTLHTR